jgi:hypothetical protein
MYPILWEYQVKAKNDRGVKKSTHQMGHGLSYSKRVPDIWAPNYCVTKNSLNVILQLTDGFQ